MPGRGSSLYRNVVSYFGLLVLLFGALLMLGSMIGEFAQITHSPYMGIFTWMIFPSVIAFGILIVLFGMRRESLRRRRAQSTEALPFPRLDLNDPKQRRWFAVSLVGGGIMAVLFAFAGYNAFLFTESTVFCGEVCHTVMEPEDVARKAGPHARVRCVDCHVGEGVEWYVKSKLSGLHQVIAVITDDYQRPIQTPIQNLRPARETCEQCHWPEKFYGAQLMQNPHFRYDEPNTPEQISLLVKTGGGNPAQGQSAGIHWQMLLGNKIEFIARDAKLTDIPWTRATSADGTVREFVDTKHPMTAEEKATVPIHAMDCIDCHNRPSHVYIPPETAVDRGMAGGTIPKDLPWIKKVAVDTLVQPYADKDAAKVGMRKAIESFYQDKYPDVLKNRKGDLDLAIDSVTGIWTRSVFPAMKVDWKTYASNIGHRNWPGCFRCHDGDHQSADGTAISTDCTICHTLPVRGPLMALGSLPPTSEQNWHPWDLSGRHKDLPCTQCHEAGYRPPTGCVDCHKINTKAPMMKEGCDQCHQEVGRKQPQNACTDCHDSLKGLHTADAHSKQACTTCHAPHAWASEGRETCVKCHKDQDTHNAPKACAGCHGGKFRGDDKTNDGKDEDKDHDDRKGDHDKDDDEAAAPAAASAPAT